MYDKEIKQNTRSTSSDSSSTSDSNYSNEKSIKESSREMLVHSNFDLNDKIATNFINRDKVRLVRGKIVRGQKDVPKYFSGYDLTAVKKRPRMTMSHSRAVLHFIN